jgi:lipid-binding SYLF domain-containing protein
MTLRPEKATRPRSSRAALACWTNARHNTFNRLQRCHERREEVIDAFFDLAEAITTVHSLIRQGFLPPGLNGSGQLVAHRCEAWTHGLGTRRLGGRAAARRGSQG